jgi:hypothetical protein
MGVRRQNRQTPEERPGIKRKHGFDLDRLAEELGKARSLEDVGDKLAETLFGEEMAQAAAEVAAMVAADAAANNPPAKDQPVAARPAARTPTAAKPAVSAPAAAPSGAPRTGPGKANGTSPEFAPRNSPPATAKPAAPKAGQATPPAPAVKNAGATKPLPPVKWPSVEVTLSTYPDTAPAAPTQSPIDSPDPIEQQFGSSMTATLKALSAAQLKQMEEPEPDDEKEKPSRRLFGFFRGSS